MDTLVHTNESYVSLAPSRVLLNGFRMISDGFRMVLRRTATPTPQPLSEDRHPLSILGVRGSTPPTVEPRTRHIFFEKKINFQIASRGGLDHSPINIRANFFSRKKIRPRPLPGPQRNLWENNLANFRGRKTMKNHEKS